jgi:hypothetical protein
LEPRTLHANMQYSTGGAPNIDHSDHIQWQTSSLVGEVQPKVADYNMSSTTSFLYMWMMLTGLHRIISLVDS